MEVYGEERVLYKEDQGRFGGAFWGDCGVWKASWAHQEKPLVPSSKLGCPGESWTGKGRPS